MAPGFFCPVAFFGPQPRPSVSWSHDEDQRNQGHGVGRASDGVAVVERVHGDGRGGQRCRFPPDAGQTCARHCQTIGMRLSAVAIMAENVGCVCQPAGAPAARAPPAAGEFGTPPGGHDYDRGAASGCRRGAAATAATTAAAAATRLLTYDSTPMATVNWPRGLAKVLVPALFAFGYLLRQQRRHASRLDQVLGIGAADPARDGHRPRRPRTSSRPGGPAPAKLIYVRGPGVALWRRLFLCVQGAGGDADLRERAPLVTVDDGNQRRLRHPTLGFSLLHPGPGFVEGDANASRPSAHFYSFTDAEARYGSPSGFSKGEGDARSLRRLLEGMSKNTDALGGRAGTPPRVEKLEVLGHQPPRGALEMVLGDGRFLANHAYGWRASHGTPFAHRRDRHGALVCPR